MTRRYKTSRGKRKWQHERRVTNAAANRCINDNKAHTHGPPVNGVRCEACRDTHRMSR